MDLLDELAQKISPSIDPVAADLLRKLMYVLRISSAKDIVTLVREVNERTSSTDNMHSIQYKKRYTTLHNLAHIE